MAVTSISSFSPGSGSVGEGIGISGFGFTGATSVKFGGVEAVSFSIIDFNTIIAYIPAGAVSGSITVVGTDNSDSHAGFTFIPSAAPEITSFTPIATPPGNKVTINGSGFADATAVKFGGIDALFFRIVSDTVIEAYPNMTGSNIISVEGPGGSDSLSGFTLLLINVRLIDLPQLNRAATNDDLVYVWDAIRSILTQSPISNLPGVGDGGSGLPGNIYTALGSPFKVRVTDDNYEFTAGTGGDAPGFVTITDVRLLGKTDYVVSASDVSNEFENDRLEFDADAGTVKILNYQLTGTKHVTIYADGIVTTQFTSFMTSMQAQIAKLMKVAAPFLPSLDGDGVLANPGGLVAWFRPAIEIPDGWAEWTPGRNRYLRGQDPTDIYNAITNPDGASRANGTAGGSKSGIALVADNIPEIQLSLFSAAGSAGSGSDKNISAAGNAAKPVAWTSSGLNGNQDYNMKIPTSLADPTLGKTSKFGKATPDAIGKNLDPYRIVNFIYSTQTA